MPNTIPAAGEAMPVSKLDIADLGGKLINSLGALRSA